MLRLLYWINCKLGRHFGLITCNKYNEYTKVCKGCRHRFVLLHAEDGGNSYWVKDNEYA